MFFLSVTPHGNGTSKFAKLFPARKRQEIISPYKEGPGFPFLFSAALPPSVI
jgi:hypothetical protein